MDSPTSNSHNDALPVPAPSSAVPSSEATGASAPSTTTGAATDPPPPPPSTAKPTETVTAPAPTSTEAPPAADAPVEAISAPTAAQAPEGASQQAVSQQAAQAQPPKTRQPSQNTSVQQNTSNAAPQPRRPGMTRDRFNHQSLGASLNSSVKKARVLMVGAGGIGCELLKNLSLSGYGEIHIVDLDTIDLSNLNRQFLFRHEHIKKSKALVAKEAAERFNGNVKIVAHHANIKDAEFTVSWFRGFTMVFNALDNLDARRHVNRMCLAADVPLIESGTTGFNGQVQVIKKGVTACYDCSPKETPKTFPVCTIRSTPSQAIHCIVWGKSYLLNEIFGTSEDQAAFDHSSDADNAHEIEELKRESDELKKIREAVGTPEFPQLLFNKVFKKDIERLRSVEDMWKSKRKPESLSYETVLSQAGDVQALKADILRDDQRVWSLEESLIVFIDSLDRLSKRILELKASKVPSSPEPTITFDKDDEDTLDFVASSANIRSTVFGIDRQSRFDIKQMAGNIIPAIATTNAIVAGLCVLESFKVLQGDYKQTKEVFLTPFAPARLLAPDKSRLPSPDCPVCGVCYVSVAVDFSRTTLNDVVGKLVKEQLGFSEREFSLNNDVGILYDPDETENLSKKLSDLGRPAKFPNRSDPVADEFTGVRGGGFLTIIDDDDDPFVNVVIDIQEQSLEDKDGPLKALFSECPDIPRKPRKGAADSDGAKQNGDHRSKDEVDSEAKGVKRPLDGADRADQPAKKAKHGDTPADDTIVLDEAGGAIIIDDD